MSNPHNSQAADGRIGLLSSVLITEGGFGMVLVVQQIIQLLSSIGFAAYGLGYLIDALSQVPWGAIVDWFHAAPAIQMAPQLSLGNEARSCDVEPVQAVQEFHPPLGIGMA
jgi:hypothetical protein